MIKPLPPHLRYKLDQKGQKLPLTKREQKRWLKNNPFLNADFQYILMNRTVTQDFIRKAINLYGIPNNLDEVLYWSTVSESFIRQYDLELDWDIVCWQQSLSEDFIRQFGKIFTLEQWEGISAHQVLDLKFLRQKRRNLDLVTIIRRGYLEEDKVRQIFGFDI